MHNVNFLNLEYFFVRAVDFVAGFSFPVGAIPDWVTGAVHIILIIGMILTAILLVLVVYAQIRMVQTEHEGFHAMEEEEHEHIAHVHGPEGETAGGHVNNRWDDIIQMVSSGNESDWRRAILEADIMLSDALTQRGFTAATVGEQLKQANPIQMRTLDLAWDAHKVRNRVAHDGEKLTLTDRDVRAAIDQYRRALEELGAL